MPRLPDSLEVTSSRYKLVCWKVLSGLVYIPIITSFGSRNIGRLFHGPWRYLAARTGQPTTSTMLLFKLQQTVSRPMKWPICVSDGWYVTKDVSRYKQMQPNPIISFLSQSFKAVDFRNLSVLDVLFIRTQRNYSIQISLHKKNITLLGYA